MNRNDTEIAEEEFKDDVMNALFGSNREAFERKKKESLEKKKKKVIRVKKPASVNG